MRSTGDAWQDGVDANVIIGKLASKRNAEAAVASYKFDAGVRENLLNYTYNAAIIAHESGNPMMRAMALDFPHEPRLPRRAIAVEFRPGRK